LSALASVLLSLYAVKTILNIFSSLLMLMFLVPATGFYYTRHSCVISGEVQLVLDGKHSCCTKTDALSHDPVNQEDSCCDRESFGQADNDSEGSSREVSFGCCINEGFYLKSEDEYTSTGRVEMPQIEIIITAAPYTDDLFQYVQESIEENAHSPPYYLSSVDILHEHSVLII
jgi:hypothetical protein